ncbi:MAG: N-acetyltransferase [Actinobacteria bacterium]|jgi:predicted GNAT family acetyltransferase|nr:N-acetyltransferase [Actinomycetota bacterium]
MAKYSDELQAQADGFRIEHQPDRYRFVLLQAGADSGEAGHIVGEAHYTLLGEDGIDFDHTVVDPSLRGTGLSGLLAERALTDDVVRGRKIQASCWYIEGYLERNPHLAA